MPPAARLRVYLSSTYQDLVEHRRAVHRVLRRLGYWVIGMEDYAAADVRPLDQCLADVREAEVYVGIFAWRYGFVPPDTGGASITELEYRAASTAGKKRLIFLARDRPSWPVDQIEVAAEAQVTRLRDELRKDLLVSEFATPDELAIEVLTAITKMSEERAGVELARLQHEQVAARGEREQVHVVNLPPLEAARFVDRVPERELLRAHLVDETVRVVQVLGRPSMGKTALVSAVLGELENRLEAGEIAAGGLDGIVYLSARTATGLSLERLVTDARRLLSPEASDVLADTWSSHDTTIEQKVETFLSAFRHRRIAVLLDAVDVVLDGDRNIQEPGMREFFHACVRQAGAPLVVLTSRADVTTPPEAAGAVVVVKVDRGLDPADACALLRELDPQGDLELRGAPDEQLERVAALTGGIPRALELLVGILQRDRLVSLERLLEDETALGAQTVEGLVAEGYRLLDDDERRLLQVLAVFGTPVPATAVSFLLQPWFPGIDVNRGIGRLVGCYFATANRRTGEVSLQAVDREYAYRDIVDGPPDEFGRTALELRAAEFYAGIRTPRDQWRTLEDVEPQLAEFEHCSRAGAFDRALELLESVDERLALWGHYLRLVELRTRLLDKPVRPDLHAANLAGLGGCLQALGQYDAAVPHLEDALHIAQEEGDTESEIRYAGNLGRLYRNLGDMDQAATFLERALAFYDSQGDRGGMAVWSDRVGLAYWHRGQLSAALELGTRGLALSREVHDGRTEAAALSNIALTHETAGDVEAARAALADSVDIARRVGDRRGEVIAIGRLGNVAYAAGDMPTAIDRHTEALAIAQALGERREQSYQLMGLGRAQSAQGDLAGGSELLFAARGLDVPETSYLAGVRLGLVRWRAGDGTGAAAAFDDGARRCQARLGRCERLFAARYAFAIALVGGAACRVGEAAGVALLAAATDELSRAIANCHGRGILVATSKDLAALRDGGASGTDALTALLDAALADGIAG